MINFKTRTDTAITTAILTSLLILVGTGVYMMVVPKPTSEGKATGRERTYKKVLNDLESVQKNLTETKAAIDAKVWDVPVAQIGPKTLESITSIAQKAKLKVVAFRPQKPVPVNGLTQLPFIVSLEGSYVGVMNLVHEIEAKGSKIAPSLVQFSSTDSNSDLVTATVGIVAYAQENEKKPSTSDKKSAATKTASNKSPNPKENLNAEKTN